MTQVGRAAETPDVAPASGAQPTGQQPSKARRWRYSLPGLAGALVFVCLSLSPSLLPRTGVIQGLVCGITAAIGYGVGVVAAWAWRAFADRVPRRTTHRSWRVFAVVSCVCLVAAMTFGRYWQGQIRMRMGVAPDGLSSLLVTPLLAALVFVALIASARTLRGLYRWAARRLERWIGPRAAHAVGWTAVVVGTGLLVSGVVLDGLVAAADEAFSVRNGATEPGVVQPVVPQRSGSAESLVPWASLGRQGRNFTGTGPTPEQIAAFTGSMANMPIRAYAGLDSAATAEQRARLAVDDLERAGGFDRRHPCGGHDHRQRLGRPGRGRLVRVHDRRRLGDRRDAVLLPPVVDVLPGRPGEGAGGGPGTVRRGLRPLVEAAARPPTEAVRGRARASAPSAVRPRSAASTTCATAPPERCSPARRTSTPSTGSSVDDRDAGSPEVQPVYRDGRTVRFTNDAGRRASRPAGQAWDGHAGALPAAPLRPDRLVEPAA